MELQVPSNRWRPIGAMVIVLILCLDTKIELRKQWEELESMRVREMREWLRNVKVIKRESGDKRADTLSWMNLAMRCRSMQPSAWIAFSRGLQTIFLSLQSLTWTL
jgi:hypothetical protein